MEPALVIMAAGMGSRFGGLKQITPVDDRGHAIIDYSLFDARRAGFKRVVFIIKRAIESDFRAFIGNRMEKYFDVSYVFQELDALPQGYSVPEGRVKPWGTAHAVACCREVLDCPFAVINSDDFYGAGAYREIYSFLSADHPENEHAMVGYRLSGTVTENGAVARGECTVENGYLRGITERTKIEKRGDDAAWTEDGHTWHPMSGDTVVSMNFWGFSAAVPQQLWEGFPAFLDEALRTDPLKSEYFLPTFAGDLIASGRGKIHVLPCSERWHGVTYREDLPDVTAAIAAMRGAGQYPEALWE